ncbi:hypothetical protein NVP1076O_66 [Vibrio phage 1.076.O._10N.286.51.B7]|nr:hypothetical protein NVP1076O_66 [Vibrio phage 1.076.O._10N.286.51.B7]
MNLRYDMYSSPNNHPQKVMEALGITYKYVVPQSIADQWWFYDCENVPSALPEYLTKL